jgi:cysteine synthase
VTLAEYARTAQVDSDALYRWRALFKRKGVSILEGTSTASVSFAAVRVAAAAASSSSAVTVHLGAVVQVRCTSMPDPRWLAELLHQLQERQ